MTIKLVLIVILAGLAYQDFKDRSVSVWLLALFGVAAIVVFFSLNAQWIDLLFNLAYLTIFLGLSWSAVHFILKRKWNEVLGSADLIFLLSITPLFGFEEFMTLIVVMMIFSLVLHWILSQLRVVQGRLIPLVGYMAVFIMGVEIRTMF